MGSTLTVFGYLNKLQYPFNTNQGENRGSLLDLY